MTKVEERERYAKEHTIREFAEHYNLKYRTALNYISKNKLAHKTEYEKHNMRHTRLYRIWSAMKTRCTNQKQPNWQTYGKKGICICAEWESFVVFSEWALNNGYADNLSIDRIDNNKGYSPENCRWVTSKQQCNNKTVNHFIKYEGEKKTLMEWSEKLGFNYNRVKARLRLGWPVEKAFFGGKYEH